jgi:hypothetical protein
MGSDVINRRLLCVLTTIKLDNQTTIGTAKVNDIRTHGMLATKLGPAELPRSQTFP